ncbi:MAG: hypothetical protein QM599_11175 [Pseudoxanthomonas sp.]
MNHEPTKRWLQAYGADPQRWPRNGIDATQAAPSPPDDEFIASRRDAEQLDALLSDYRITPADAALQWRILAALPAAASARSHDRTRWSWWPAASFAGLAAAGVLAGMLLSLAILPPLPAAPAETGWLQDDTAFGPLSMEDER